MKVNSIRVQRQGNKLVLSVVSDGARVVYPLTRDRLLILLVTAFEALRGK